MLLIALLACRNKDLPEDTGPFLLDVDEDGFLEDVDCDDKDATVNPDATEACNGVDDNCDGDVDEGVLTTWFADADGDTFGDANVPIEACERPAASSADDTDCDDGNSEVYPDAGERCNDVDDDCDGDVDEEVQTTWYADADGDLHGDASDSIDDCDPPEGYASIGDDCDDADATSFPGASEVCDGADNNCDGDIDEDLLVTFYADADGDGFGTEDSVDECELPSGYAEVADDCDDTDSAVNPDAEEVCNLVDDDCDGDTDEDVTLTFYRDSDSDGYGDPAATDTGCTAPSGYVDNDEDCHDSDDTLNPDTVWTIDYDADGYGDADQSYTQSQCTQPSGYVRDTSDCDDADSDINPDGTEVCDGADNDCDGTSDNDDATDAATWYDDTDGDGYGDPDTTTTACEQPSGYLTDDTDCEPSDATAYPGSTAIEVPNDSIDQNCDGNDGCADLDCDNIADLVLAEHYDGNYATTLWVYYNDGSGNFSDSDRTALSAYGAYDVEAGDVNGDGYQDIVVANYFNGTTRDINSYVYYGSASGYSDTDRDDLPTHGALSVQVQDVDADGYADAVFGAWYSNSTGYGADAYVYYGSATGMNSGDRDALPGSGNRETEIADFDGDGVSDIVLCNQRTASTFNTNSTVYWGSSSGYSTSDTSSLPTLGCRDVDVGDLDGDGNDDIVFANYRNTSGSYSIDSYLYYGSSTGFTTTNREELATTGTLSAALGDFDGDGTTDVAFGGYYGGTSWSTTAQTVVYWNSSSGFLTSNKTSVGTRGIREVIASDIDGDGTDDLFGPTYYTGSGYSGNSYLWWGSTTGISDTDRESLPSAGAGHATTRDLDGDGFEEITFSNYYNGSSYAAGTYVYYGPATSLGSTNRDTLGTTGVWGRPLYVGP